MTTWLNTPPMQFRTIDGLSIRFTESEDHALLLSPWPESLLAFEPTWARLAEHTHLVAMDLPGFGHSQCRDALLSPRAMGEFVMCVAGSDRFVESMHYVRTYPTGPPDLADLLPEIQTSVQIIAGRRDPVVSPISGEHDAVLIDGALTPEDAGRVVDWIRASPTDLFSRDRSASATDVGSHRPRPAARGAVHLSPAGMLLLSPLPHDVLRVVATVHDPAISYHRDAIQQLLDERGPTDTRLRVEDVVQSRPYRVTTGLAERFRAGRIFLAGDAAHVHSPAGGQGMNTGIQDAINLAWKLAAVLHGSAPQGLLDTYDSERRPNAAALLGFTVQLTALAELNKPAAMRLRDQLLHVAGEVKELPGFLALKMAQLDISYATPEEDDWVGTRLPPHGSWAITLRWALLLPPSRHDATMSLPDHQNLVIGQSPTDVAFLVRPDGHVAAASTDLSDSALRELLARTYWQGPTGKDLLART